MARNRSFDVDTALDGAARVFREHGYEGTSAQMLVDAMGIGRQSLYDAFGDKWQLYLSVVRRYVIAEGSEHRAALLTGERAIDGIRAMLDRVVRGAKTPCLGVSSIAEFGCARPELTEINAAADRGLRAAMLRSIRKAQAEGDISVALDPDQLATFLMTSFAGIRIAARGGARPKDLASLGEMALRAMR
ncbi:helix-turn-helix transcriptional regulator [Bradyrhizobium sp. U87765 SZCCT0131]|jgi:TetR/AcrR family transcriptional regulator, transcriptional repressor for nem operon|uniref:TetR/AcrR family transcriptional regulator n=1 Tax=unclassified Bradyrhizobium TaxID=2631580 RepID=UPI001BA8F27D|nr:MULTISPECIES: TetR/AcrR family transcriptional regulator [unclassified Bradyrhizobium]MBR1221503.1 helix-turn-helix transcriptional regulator [Bradyrhizobium sp. U87765 SZCCT0131]MBR1264574.1 helix-turn-helix transcriptional regulator [Bradyrhizobium sp. U87765 SZCCT0134]MBR1304520.1 helix-turn-helix transcriptional regulator [Bradyrhizobium sp. U87765 SZCCT0110]MBR1322623.1 helix-turn-helix transcriptional regulator [Bradyrhizobium sp. U87765 SZCCT0109]MBR1346449.1 helix-turn-helix transcr